METQFFFFIMTVAIGFYVSLLLSVYTLGKRFGKL